jgi:hypothetical protein
VASHAELIFIIVISNQFKTGVRMRLTSSVKELEAILQKLINLDKIQNENETNDGLLAMRMPSDLRSSGLGSVQQRKRILFSQELDKKKAVINSVG